MHHPGVKEPPWIKLTYGVIEKRVPRRERIARMRLRPWSKVAENVTWQEGST